MTENILDIPFKWDDAGGITTLRKSFKLLLYTLFIEEEEFSGKRPLGNSGWQYDLGIGLINAGILEGDPDDPQENYFDYATFQQLIKLAIYQL